MASKMSAADASKLWEGSHPDSTIFIEPGTSQYLRDTYIRYLADGDDVKEWARIIRDVAPSVTKRYLIEVADQAYDRDRTTNDSAEFENFMIQLLAEGRLTINPSGPGPDWMRDLSPEQYFYEDYNYNG